MALESFVTSFPTGTGAASTTVTVAHGLSAAPKFLLLEWGGITGGSTTDTEALAAMRLGIGFVNCVPGTPINVCAVTNSAAGQLSTGRGARSWISVASCVVLANATAATSNGALNCTAVDATNVTFTIQTAFTATLRISMMAMGGSDLANVHVFGMDTPATATGTNPYTGMGFTPYGGSRTLLLTARCDKQVLDLGGAPAYLSLGAAVNSTNTATAGYGVLNSSGATTRSRSTNNINTGEIAALPDLTSATTTDTWGRAEFTSWDSDGFTLNQLEGTATVSTKVIFAVLNGPTFRIASGVTGSTLGSTAEIANIGFRPDAGFIFGTASAVGASNVSSADARISMGIWDDGGREQCGGGSDQDAVATSVCSQHLLGPTDSYVTMSSAGVKNGKVGTRFLTADGAVFETGTATPSGGNTYFVVFMGPATQVVNPIADVAAGGWTTDAGASVGLSAAVDEGRTANDADYIKSTFNPVQDLVKLQLRDPGTPVAGPWLLTIRHYRQ